MLGTHNTQTHNLPANRRRYRHVPRHKGGREGWKGATVGGGGREGVGDSDGQKHKERQTRKIERPTNPGYSLERLAVTYST